MLLLDVDHYKAFNDRDGHLAGDQALRFVAHALVSATRGQDLIARYGGEKFAALLPHADRAALHATAERMRAAVEDTQAHPANLAQPITISVGGVLRVPSADDTSETLLRDADDALYRTKQAGRNRVEIAGEC